MTKRSASLKDIAATLGISIATVSRALQNNPVISKATRELVQHTAREMNYSRNYIADSLRKGNLPIIGVIVPHGVTLFYSSILDGIETTAAKEGYAVINMNSHESYIEEKQCIDNLRKLQVSGIIASVTQETTDFSHFNISNIPVVFVARYPDNAQHSVVSADGEAATYKATCHLIKTGCKHIALLSGPNDLKMARDRKHGYLEALRDNGITIDQKLVANSNIDIDAAKESTKRLLAHSTRPDAILTLNNTLLFGAMRAIKEMHLRIPEDIALIGFSDVSYAEDVVPALSTIEDQSYEMGETACKILFDHIRGQEKTVRKIIPTVLKIRQSSK